MTDYLDDDELELMADGDVEGQADDGELYEHFRNL